MNIDWASCANDAGVATLNCIPLLISNLIWWFLSFAGTITVLFIIVAGYKYITSHGDSKKVDEARKTLVYSILGLMVIFLSFFIVNTLAQISGVGCVNLNNPLSFTACK